MSKYIITFSNGYCGCGDEQEFEGTLAEAKIYAEEALDEYTEQYAYVAFGWDEPYTEEEFDEYRENCEYSIEEWEEEEEEYDGEWEDDWNDDWGEDWEDEDED